MDTPVLNNPSLLLVEENSVVLDSLRDWLAMAFPDVRLIETSDHSYGIHLNRSEAPDVVLMDISSHGKNGIESVRSMKAAQPAAAVFALVSLEHESYYRALLKAGAEACACIWKIRTELLPQLEKHLLPRRRGGPTSHRER
jgi:two-component system chemotaxis response regulator CheY